MDAMLALAEERFIKVHYSNNLGNGIDGIYIEERGIPPIIGINKRILSNTRYTRCVFAEELGHHFTTVGDHVPKEFYCYAQRVVIDREEYKAMRWATNYLIPENDLLDCLRDGLYEIWELAEHFRVTDDFMRFRIKLFRGE